MDSISEGGLSGRFEASPKERAALAGELGLLELNELSCDYEISPAGAGRFHVRGEWRAQVIQTCVITLEPVGASLGESFSAEFRPARECAQWGVCGDTVTIDALAETPEPIENGIIDLGRLITELLSVKLDPYPRKPGAQFVWSEEGAAGSLAADGPFSALKRLKRADVPEAK